MYYDLLIYHTLQRIERKVDLIMSEQAEIDQDVAELNTAVTNIQAEIAALQAANPALDLSALQTAIAAVAAIAPAAPPPAG
jgi:peptidoglycan hydrolase CwlO-like protein